MDALGIIAALKRLGVPHDRIAEAIGRDRTAATKMLAGSRSMKAVEMGPLADLVAEYESSSGELADRPRNSDLAEAISFGRLSAYLPVEVLPTFVGMGGGGTGEGDRATALLPRALVTYELRATPADLLIINVRGDSMTPIFEDGDRIVIDRRDRNPRQPGPFALWYGDGYVVKNVEIIRSSGRLRIFSQNPIYQPEEAEPEEVTILGRPVFFARRI